MNQQQLATLIEDRHDYRPLGRNEIREATILSIGDHRIIVDLGVKRDGVIPSRDLKRLDLVYQQRLHVGDTVPVLVVDASSHRDEIAVSLTRGLTKQDWQRAETLFENGKTCDLQVISANKGGVIVRFGHLQGFVPNSHLLSVPRHLRGRRFRQAKANLVGQNLSLKVIEMNRHQRRLVLSERDLDPWRRRQLLQELLAGQIRTGTVRNLVDFGAFVDLGGVDGLIHISELDWKRIGHPSEILDVGQKVQVRVLSVDPRRERVRLSRKRLLPDPWSQATERLQEGNVVKGIVTTIADFGVFVDLGEGVEGLAHISKMAAEGRSQTSLQPGSIVWVRILKIDLQRRRIALDVQRVGSTTLWSKIGSLWKTIMDLFNQRRRSSKERQGDDKHGGKRVHR